MNGLWKYRLLYLTVIVLLFIIDQGTKIWAIQILDHHNVSYQLIKDYLELTIVYNPGAAWGIFSGWTQPLAVMSTFMIIIILTMLGKTSLKDRLLGWALTFQLGGAFGNLYDRVSTRPGVVDFIKVNIPWGGGEGGIWDRFFGKIGLEGAQHWVVSKGPIYDYPVFNFADIWVVIGTIMLLIYILRMPPEEKGKKPRKGKISLSDQPGEDDSTKLSPIGVPIDSIASSNSDILTENINKLPEPAERDDAGE
jgi:signal peptidase II